MKEFIKHTLIVKVIIVVELVFTYLIFYLITQSNDWTSSGNMLGAYFGFVLISVVVTLFIYFLCQE